MSRLIAAFTSANYGVYPYYINLTERDHGGAIITVRGNQKDDGSPGDSVSIELQEHELRELIISAVSFFNWLPSWVAEHNAEQERAGKIEQLKRQISTLQIELDQAIWKDERIKNRLDSWSGQ